MGRALLPVSVKLFQKTGTFLAMERSRAFLGLGLLESSWLELS